MIKHRGIALTAVTLVIAIGGMMVALHGLLVAPCTATIPSRATHDPAFKDNSDWCRWIRSR